MAPLPADLARMMSPTPQAQRDIAPPPLSHMQTPKTAPLLPPTPQTLPLNINTKENSNNTLPPPTPNRNFTFAPPPSNTLSQPRLHPNSNLTTPVQPRIRQPLHDDTRNAHVSLNDDNDNDNRHNNASLLPLPDAFATPKSLDHAALKSRAGQTFAPTPLGTGLSLLSSPCPPIALASAARLKRQHNPHQQLSRKNDENAIPDTFHPLKTPVSALSTRTMGRSISTPTLPINTFPLGSAYNNGSSVKSARSTSTRFSPSSESQRSTSHARPGSQMSFSPSPTPSSPQPIQLAGIQPPAAFPGPYPTAYLRKDPVPTEETENETPDVKRSSRQGAPSWNPWDYVLHELPPTGAGSENQTPMKETDDGKNKIRRRFTKRELEALEVLWSISKSPSKYERQRLGAWLGVKTKHITVWFQNRRQEEKRYQREGGPSSEPPPPSRSNRGTFDPVTGKWRPVPLSCISGLQPPPEEKSAVVRAISVGDITRDMYFAQYPHGGYDAECDSLSQTPTQSSGRSVGSKPVPKRGLSNSLEEVLQARESGFGEDRKRLFRRGSPELAIKGEGQERIREILSLMPSDPPSIDLAELAEDDEDGGEDEEEDSENDSPTEAQEVKRRKPINGNALGLATSRATNNNGSSNGLGRATSLDILASSVRAKYLQKPKTTGGVLGSMNVNIPLESKKRTLPSLVPFHPSKKIRSDLTRPTPSTLSTFRQKDSFSRSQSAAVLTSSPTQHQNDKENGVVDMMKTPGFARSFSFSSNNDDDADEAITPDNVARSKVMGSLKVKRTEREGQGDENVTSSSGQEQKRQRVRGGENHDEEVLGAAEKLLLLLGQQRG